MKRQTEKREHLGYKPICSLFLPMYRFGLCPIASDLTYVMPAFVAKMKIMRLERHGAGEELFKGFGTIRGVCAISLTLLRVPDIYIIDYTPEEEKSKDGIMYNFILVG